MNQLPYSYRIMACLPGSEPVELHRSKGRYTHKSWSFWTSGMSSDWVCWCEYTIADRFCLSPRIRPRYVAPVDSNGCRMPLTSAELAKVPGHVEYAFNQ